jgi:hypothetical protein
LPPLSTTGLSRPRAVHPPPLPPTAQNAQCTYSKETGELAGSGWGALVGIAKGTTFMAPCPKPPQPQAPPPPGARAAGGGGPGGGGGGRVRAAGVSSLPPAPVGARLLAAIASPSGLVPSRGGAPAAVTLDAAGTTAAVLRPITSYSWTVRGRQSNATLASASGPQATLELPPGAYSATLTVRDTLGLESSAVREFAVGERATPLARIAAPRDVELAAPAAGPDGAAAARVVLSAAGSAPGPGALFAAVQWTVQRLPGLEVAAEAAGTTALVELPLVGLGRARATPGPCARPQGPEQGRRGGGS